MGIIIIPKRKCFPAPVYDCGAGEIRAHPAAALLLGQYFIYGDCDEFPRFVTEPEAHRRNLAIRVSAGNHLHRDIDAQYALHPLHSFPEAAVYLS